DRPVVSAPEEADEAKVRLVRLLDDVLCGHAGVTAVTIGLYAGISQDSCEELCAHVERRHEHVLAGSMRAAALGAEAVEHRHAGRGEEVPVGAACDGRLVQVEPERAAVFPRALEQEARTGRALERRSRPAAAELYARAFGLCLELMQDAVDALALAER